MNRARLERLEKRTRKAEAVRVVVHDLETDTWRDALTGERIPKPERTVIVKRLGNVSMEDL